ncbi:ankyrin repeat and protein kinase domain-containing protein 1 [Brachionichthys hirsutus]|uniref:ankyrin repeat and protein kinase domain-containing protein 1 n=1 Tax=Brachionichthys hirsutus TaxID=412623 RepID=UPI0036048656
MDYRDRSHGCFNNFNKDSFEADWIKLAEGRFAQVYKVKLRIGRVTYALKSFDATPSGDKFYRRILQEKSNISKRDFKYIVSIYGTCSEANAVVMEYMSNGSLNNLLASHILMWPKKFQMIHEVSMGINFLHSLTPPLLHLNLKTANILLDDHLHVKISDFDLIHWEEGMSKKLFMENLTVRGNISYIPPETFSQRPDPPQATFDVYSFGIVIWEILTQQKSYAGCSVTTVILEVSQGKRPSVEIIPEQKPNGCDQMINIMTRCWNQDRRKRPQFSDIVKETEALSEGLKIRGSMQCQTKDDEEQKPNHPWPVFPTPQITVPEMPDLPSDGQCCKDSILSLLYRKDFCCFRQSVRREHVHKNFPDRKSLLHYTAASGNAESVERVLTLGAQVNCITAKGYTALMIASLYRFHDVVSLLLEHGAATTLGEEEQWTALHFAAQNGDDRTVRLLLDKGAVADAQEQAGWTPLHLACQNGHETVVRLLLSRLSEEAVEERDAQGRTPLHLASTYGHVNIAKLLLSQGADPNATDCSLSTALHLSAEEGHNRAVRQLLKNGVTVDSADSSGYTPLHLAALHGHTGICRQLLLNGANPNTRTLQGWAPMHLAALKGHGATVVQLESQGGCVNTRGSDGWTPLHLACQQNEPNVVDKLLESNADPNVCEDSDGWTPLHMACTSVSVSSVVHLLSHHADVNAMNAGKATALHLAAQHGFVPLVKTLVLNGADRTLLDSSGSTALDVAQKCGKLEIVQLLKE